MKKTLLRTTCALVLCALLGGAALAATKNRNVTFAEDVSVGGTVLKKGTYKVSFDDQSKELTFRRNGKIVAKTTARLEEAKTNWPNPPEYKSRRESSALSLTSVNLGGSYAVIGEASAAGQE